MDRKPPLLLIIEDQVAHCELINICLKNGNIPHRTSQIVNGEDAVQYLKKTGKYEASVEEVERPALILLDLHIPKIDGFEVLKIIKTDKELAKIPVVVFTTSDSAQDIAKAFQNHANSYVVKPTNFDEFQHALKNIVYYWLNLNTLNTD